MLVQSLVDLQGLQGNFLACLSLFYSFKKLLRFLQFSDLCQNLSFGNIVICIYSDDSSFPLLELQGLLSEFSVPKGENPSSEQFQFQWLYVNGLLAIIFCFGLLLTAIKSRRARSWPYGTGVCYIKWFCESFFSFFEVKNHFNWLPLFLFLVLYVI